MKPGTFVRMTEALKEKMRPRSGPHIEEFGHCIGIVEGPVQWANSAGPELDVRWQPSNLRYMYNPEDLEVVVRQAVWARRRPRPRRHPHGGIRQLQRSFGVWVKA